MSFDATNYNAAIFNPERISITPSIFSIGTYSKWVILITEVPSPFEKECYIKITVPSDLGYEKTALVGQGLFNQNNNFESTIG